MAERSKALVSGTSLFGGGGSNPPPITNFAPSRGTQPESKRPARRAYRQNRLDGRAVQGASLRHWSLRRRGFESPSNHFLFSCWYECVSPRGKISVAPCQQKCSRRGSNPRSPAHKTGALPLSYASAFSSSNPR